MRHQRLGAAVPPQLQHNSLESKTNESRPGLYRSYTAFVLIVFAYFLFRVALIWRAGDFAFSQPIPSSRPCWNAQLKDAIGAAPCQDYGVQRPQENAKVALMFLVRHNIPTEPIWTAFIASAAELQLKQHVPATAPGPPSLMPSSRHETGPTPTCTNQIAQGRYPEEKAEVPMQPITNTTAWIQQTLDTTLSPRELYEMQDLFSIYVHRTPGFEERISTSIFYGRDIQDRVHATISQPSLVQAHRALLREALKDPRNTMFVLVSEACVPLHHPALFWSQLLAESHVSRVIAARESMHRWVGAMTYGDLKKTHFLKGSQWTALTRMHAMIVSDDDYVWPRFDVYCRSRATCGLDVDLSEAHCIADEHYVATVLSVYEELGQGTASPLRNPLTKADFREMQLHPTTFMSGSFDSGISALKCSHWKGYGMQYDQSLASVRSLFNYEPHTPQSWFSNSIGDTSTDFELVNVTGEDWNPVYAVEAELLENMGEEGVLPGDGDSKSSALDGKRKTKLEVVKAQLAKGQLMKEQLYERRRRNDTHTPRIGVHTNFVQRWQTEKRKKDFEGAMKQNLDKYKWLAQFQPLKFGCPLLGRRISIDAVSEWASKAWDCNGLGYSWKCI